MKLRVVAAWAVGSLAAMALAFAENTGAKSEVRINLDEATPAKPAPTPTTKKPAGGATAPSVKPGAKAVTPKDGEQKKPEPPKIDGMEISRGDAGYLGVKIADNHFKMSFYGKDRKPKPVDVSRAALRWPVQYQKSDERVVLLPDADGKSLSSEKVVRPPFTFKLYITLLKDTAPGEDPAAENYVVDFSQ